MKKIKRIIYAIWIFIALIIIPIGGVINILFNGYPRLIDACLYLSPTMVTMFMLWLESL